MDPDLAGRYVDRLISLSNFSEFRLSLRWPAKVCDHFGDLAAVYRREIAALEAAGCRYIQINDHPVELFSRSDVGPRVVLAMILFECAAEHEPNQIALAGRAEFGATSDLAIAEDCGARGNAEHLHRRIPLSRPV